MTALISLRNVVDEMQMLTQGLHSYLNKRSGEIVTISDEDFARAEADEDLSGYADWEQEAIQEAKQVLYSEDYLKFPDETQVDRYVIMKEFCISVKNQRTSAALLELIEGSGAFRRFKAAIMRYGIEQDWYSFQDKALKVLAVEWLEKFKIEFSDDMQTG